MRQHFPADGRNTTYSLKKIKYQPINNKSMKFYLFEEFKISHNLFFRKMRITCFLLFVFASGVFAIPAASQVAKVSINMENTIVSNVLDAIEKQTDYLFVYNKNEIDLTRKVSVNVDQQSVAEVLTGIFDKTDIIYAMEGSNIMLMQRTNAQQSQKQISGKVTDKTGAALPGVTVVIKGTTTGIVTDNDGNFSFSNLPENAILIFSFVGMTRQEIKVEGRAKINITMEEEILGLGDIVVVGYGTQKKVNVTGAVDMVSGEKLANRPAINMSGLLQGLSPNMEISMSKAGGEPGAEQTWQIRGVGSISGNDRPLILVDGVEMNINLVDPESVESVSVLKDASASALYGSRAAFGVVLVTTKKGKAGQPLQIQYSNNLAVAVPIYVPNMYDSYTYATAFNQAADNAGVTHTFTDAQVERIKGYIAGTYKTPYDPARPPYSIWRGRWDGNANENWTKEYYKSSTFHQKHNLSVNGGDKKTKYYFNTGFLDEPGLYSWGNDGYKRFNMIANVSTEISNWVRFDFGMKYARNITDAPIGIVGVPRSYLWLNFLAWFPMQPKANIDGSRGGNPQQLVLEKGGRIVTQNDDLWTNLGIELEPIKGWKTNLKYYYNNKWGSEVQTPLPVPYKVPNGTVGNVGESMSGYRTTLKQGQYSLFSGYTSYEKSIKGHYFKAIAGYERDEDYNRGLYGSKMQLITVAVPSISTAVGDFTLDDYMNHWATEGYFGRLNYNYEEKYLFEASARYDGSSRFASDSRWGFFPSVSAGYNIAKENFWTSLKPYVNTLKIRGSYGSLGNQNVENYLYLSTIPVAYRRDPYNYSNPGYIIDNEIPLYAKAPDIKSSNLTWETITTLDFGADAAFLNNRLDFVFDWYNRTTSDMIGPSQELPSVLGTTAPPSNNAELSTKGYEISLSWRDKVSSNFSYNVKFTLGDSKTKILKYLNKEGSIGTWYEGKTYGEVWGLTTDAMIQKAGETMPDQTYYYSKWGPGDIKYKDINGDGKINPGLKTVDDHGDLSVIGNTSPRYNYGLSAGFNWKNFDFNMFWQGVGKRDMFPGPQTEYFWGLIRWNSNSTLLKEGVMLDYWRPENETNFLGPNTDAYLPKPYFSPEGYKNYEVQTRYKLNAAYLRLKNIQIGYSIPQSVLNKTFIKKARVYFSGENLLTFTKLPKLFEPESIAASNYEGGGDGGAYGYVEWGVIYPITQMFSFGAIITF